MQLTSHTDGDNVFVSDHVLLKPHFDLQSGLLAFDVRFSTSGMIGSPHLSEEDILTKLSGSLHFKFRDYPPIGEWALAKETWAETETRAIERVAWFVEDALTGDLETDYGGRFKLSVIQEAGDDRWSNGTACTSNVPRTNVAFWISDQGRMCLHIMHRRSTLDLNKFDDLRQSDSGHFTRQNFETRLFERLTQDLPRAPSASSATTEDRLEAAKSAVVPELRNRLQALIREDEENDLAHAVFFHDMSRMTSTDRYGRFHRLGQLRVSSLNGDPDVPTIWGRSLWLENELRHKKDPASLVETLEAMSSRHKLILWRGPV